MSEYFNKQHRDRNTKSAKRANIIAVVAVIIALSSLVFTKLTFHSLQDCEHKLYEKLTGTKPSV